MQNIHERYQEILFSKLGSLTQDMMKRVHKVEGAKKYACQ